MFEPLNKILKMLPVTTHGIRFILALGTKMMSRVREKLILSDERLIKMTIYGRLFTFKKQEINFIYYLIFF